MTVQATVIVDVQAEDDLYEIYLTRLEQRGPDGPDGAEALLDALQATIEGIADYPERGPIPAELEALGERNWRQVSHAPYRVIYLVEDGTATVALVADSRRDFASLLQARLLGA
jgi:toxin ParE1/3/4